MSLTAPVYPPIIGLYAPAPGSGKSSIACKLVIEENYVILPFADPVKAMAVTLLRNLGYDEAEAAQWVYTRKADVLPELGVTIRHILQTLGTDWGRCLIHKDIWLRTWVGRYNELIIENPDTLVVVDDLRFPEEADFLRALNSETQIVQVTRPGTATPESVISHASEGALRDYVFDYTIVNDGSLYDLNEAVDAYLRGTALVAA